MTEWLNEWMNDTRVLFWKFLRGWRLNPPKKKKKFRWRCTSGARLRPEEKKTPPAQGAINKHSTQMCPISSRLLSITRIEFHLHEARMKPELSSSHWCITDAAWMTPGNICSACSGVRGAEAPARPAWSHPGMTQSNVLVPQTDGSVAQRFDSNSQPGQDSQAEQRGMNQMKVSSEELRTLPPRPPNSCAASPKRRFVRLGRTTSDGFQQWVCSKWFQTGSGWL